MTNRTIKVDYLARVEGEGSLYVNVENGKVEDVRLSIFEPPRFFEAMLKGRHFTEAPDITARICGICPVAYQMSAVHAFEKAADITLDKQMRALRRLLYCGEWIASHTLHIYMLHAPDFLGFDDAVAMARDHGDIVRRGLRLKKAGNDIMDLLGGRAIHPINVRVGGFYAIPKKKDLKKLTEELSWARDAALETLQWTAKFDYPDVSYHYEFVSLRHNEEYPLNEGRLVSSSGFDAPIEVYETHFKEIHKAHSTALYSEFKDHGTYFVGPMARYNQNADLLSDSIQDAAKQAGLSGTCSNPFQSIIVRAIEVLFACEEALAIIKDYEEPDQPFIEVDVRDKTAIAATEAPRGLLYHRYEVDGEGKISLARIVPPTSQNQAIIEEDLARVAQASLELPDPEFTTRCEQTVRNYDPCISCAAHFLTISRSDQI